MARSIKRIMLVALAIAGMTAFLLWWWLRRRPEEVILRTELGTISRVRKFGKPRVVSSEPAAPALVSQAEGPIPSQAEGPPADDLKRIDGIGPKIASVFQDAGITTYAQLAATDVDRLRQILTDSGIRLANPDTWPDQAHLAAAGDWDDLKNLQGQLKGGRRV